MKATVSVQVKGANSPAKLKKALDELTKTDVLVGIPDDKSKRQKSSTITNAELAFLHTHGVRSYAMRMFMHKKMVFKGATYPAALQMFLHTHGSPQWQVPPRPIIEPAITAKGNREKIMAEFEKAAQAALAGNTTLMRQCFHRAGLTAVNLVRAWFTDPRNGWPPNSPATIKRKGSSQPLIDTGQLRKAITYVLRKRP